MRRGSRSLLPLGLSAAAAAAAAAIVLWFGLGMHRGLLLSEDVRSRVWPWAPFFPASRIAAPALSDPVWQFVPWLDFARAELRAGRLPLWNPHQSGGVPLLGNGESALGSPFYWPVLAMGVARAWNASLLLRLLLALAGAYCWLRELGRSRAASLLGGLAFALSGPFIAWLEHPHTLTIAAFPFVLFFTRRLARAPTPRRADLVGLAAATYFVLAGGHPETQWMAALFGAAALAQAAPRRRAVGWPVAGAFLGACLSAPFLIPFVEYFAASQARRGTNRHPFVLALSDLGRFVFPRWTGSNVIEAASTVSLIVLVLALAALPRIGRDREARFHAAVALVILLVVYRNPLSTALAAHTAVYWTRALLFLPLPLAALASGTLDRIGNGLRARGWRAAAPWVEGLAVLGALGELLWAAQGVHGRTPPEALARTTPLLDRLRADGSEFRILPLHTFLPPDSATAYGLDDIRGYDALTPEDWRGPLAAMGRVVQTPTQLDVLEAWDLVPGGKALDAWNVKYLLLHPQFAFGAAELNAKKDLDLEEVYSGPDGRILRNRRVEPRLTLAGEGRVEVEERTPGRWRVRVTSAGPAVLTLADPMFPGWKARVDGEAVRLASAPGEPMRLTLAGGGHGVEIFYAPESFRIGCLLAAAASLVLIFLVRRLPPRAVGPSDRRPDSSNV